MQILGGCGISPEELDRDPGGAVTQIPGGCGISPWGAGQ